jgi:hypothetical protein
VTGTAGERRAWVSRASVGEAVRVAFEVLELDEVVSFTVHGNPRCRRSWKSWVWHTSATSSTSGYPTCSTGSEVAAELAPELDAGRA